ncbi:MAG TPA: hypothetical protein GXX62_04755 [Alcaligenaceae bacterium]|nr:hypothetical protein [Alcaligenaceae bacterium]
MSNLKLLLLEKDMLEKSIKSKEIHLAIADYRNLFEIDRRIAMFTKKEIEQAKKELNMVNNYKSKNDNKRTIKLKEIKENINKDDFDFITAIILLMFNKNKNKSFFNIVFTFLLSDTNRPKNN